MMNFTLWGRDRCVERCWNSLTLMSSLLCSKSSSIFFNHGCCSFVFCYGHSESSTLWHFRAHITCQYLWSSWSCWSYLIPLDCLTKFTSIWSKTCYCQRRPNFGYFQCLVWLFRLNSGKMRFFKSRICHSFFFSLGRRMLGRKSTTIMALHVSMCMSSKTICVEFFLISI